MTGQGRRRSRIGVGISLAVLVLASLGSWWVVNRVEPMLPKDRFLAELAYYPSERWLQAMSFGEAPLLADITWIRAVQYYGEHRMLDNEFKLLHHALEVVTNFDSRHRNSYVFGGTSLAQEGKQFEAGEKLLLKARAANPGEWIYPFELGFIHFVERRDYLESSLWFQEAARKKDCPPYVERFAAFSTQRAGHRERACELWQMVAESTSNPVLRERAVKRAVTLSRGTGLEPSIGRWADRISRSPAGDRKATQ